MTRIAGGFGSAGCSRSLRKTSSAVGVGSSAKERDRRATFPDPARLSEPTREAILEGVECGTCAWCDDPREFRFLSHHLVRAHGINLDDLRERLVLPKGFAFASQEYREGCARRAKACNAVANAQRVSGLGRPHVLGTYGRRINAEKAAAVDPEIRLANLRKADKRKVREAARQSWSRLSPLERGKRLAQMARIGRKGVVALQAFLREHPEVRRAAIAKREAGLTPENRASRLKSLAQGRATQAIRRDVVNTRGDA